MILTPSTIEGVYVLDMQRAADERGFFARAYSKRAFADAGIELVLTQASISYNARQQTLRGMHFQDEPHAEAKVVRCTAGAIFDVAVDIRSSSPTFGMWTGVELSAENRRALVIPVGCAHGFLTLRDESEVLYLMSGEYRPESARGFRWDDAAVGIKWPAEPLVMSARDRDLAALADAVSAATGRP